MLTSFFRNSTPINYLLLSILIAASYLFKVLFVTQTDTDPLSFFDHIGIIAFMVFVMLLLDFIIRKNSVTNNNTFAIFTFVLFIIMVPSVYNDISIVLSNVFLLLATRRVLSLNTEKNTEKKIFDAAMYITIASLLYFWALLFFIVLIIGITQKTRRSPRYFLIPLLSALSIGLLFTSYQLITYDSLSWFYAWPRFQDFDFTSYNNLLLLVPAILLVGLLLWTGSVRFLQIPSLSKKEKPAASSMVLITVVLLFISILGSHNNGSELFFLMMPVAISTANFVETNTTKERAIFNEILLWLILVVALVLNIL
jgi:hypothetical protein